MVTNNAWRTMKLLIFSFVTLYLTAYISVHVYADGKSVSCIQGTVKAKKAKYIKDSIVYVENMPNTYESPKEPALMDQKNMAFIPHVLPLVKGTTVDFLNSDMVQHNIYSPDAIADNMNLGTWLKGEIRSFTFNKLGIATLKCNVHVDMLAYVLVLQNPYFARVNNDGSFSIPNVPEGKCIVKLWNERLKAADWEVEVKAGAPITLEFELK